VLPPVPLFNPTQLAIDSQMIKYQEDLKTKARGRSKLKKILKNYLEF